MARVSGVDRVVLPSPNGSSIAFGLADSGCTVVGACLRNRTAVARWLQAQGGTVAVVAAGERWPDGSLRPAAEDLWGAGAVLALLPRDGLSPEALLAADAFRAVVGEVVRDSTAPGSPDRGPFVHGLPRPDPLLATALRDCASGRELATAGFAEDVDVAAELDASDVVPVLADGAFHDSTAT